jgi:hypothetical protein
MIEGKTQLESRGAGRYERPGWALGSPGTYALVIGISDYTYLRGKETFGFDKLYVSALTAYRFFNWLEDRYQYFGTRVQKCWLLLAPTEAEVSKEPALETAGGSPTLAGCEEAIKEWYHALQSVTGDENDVSRSIVFFSGHGCQILTGKQLLLPQDYLKPPEPTLNDALSTANLAAAVPYSAVKRHFFFIDACRNDTAKLRVAEQDLTGRKTLRLPLGATQPGGYAKLLYAAAPGEQAWQPKSVDEQGGLTFYGGALVGGVSGSVPGVIDTTANPWSISFEDLMQYVSAEVAAALRRNRIDAIDPVLEDGPRAGKPPIVAHVPHDESTPSPPEPAVRKAAESLRNVARNAAAAIAGGIDPLVVGPIANAIMSQASFMRDFSQGEVFGSLFDERPEFEERHTEFGSEKVCGFFEGAALYEVDGRTSDAKLRVQRVERSRNVKMHVVSFTLPEEGDANGAVWVEFPGDGATFGVVLPQGALQFRCVTSRARRGKLSINTFEVGLGSQNEALVNKAYLAWEASRVADPLPLANSLLQDLQTYGERPSRDTSGFEIAQILQATLRAQAGPAALAELRLDDRIERATTSDLAVLALQQELNAPSRRGNRALWLADRIVEQGAPVVAPVLERLILSMDLLSEPDLPGPWQTVSAQLRSRFGTALGFYRPGGLFATYVNTEPALDAAWNEARGMISRKVRAVAGLGA